MIAQAFRDLFGHDPATIWQAPGRVNLMGDHVDYNDGLVLPFAIDRCTVVAAAARPDRQVRIASVQQDDLVECALGDRDAGWASYVLGVAWSLTESGHDVRGFDLLVDSDIPIGSGLSSSAGIEVGTALALTHLLGVTLPPLDLAMVCHLAETAFVGAPVGVMDQIASACAVEGHALLIDCRTLQTTAVPLALPGHQILVLDTGVRHDNTDGGYAARRASCEDAAAALGLKALRDATLTDVARLTGGQQRRARHVVTEIARVEATVAALRANDPVTVGRCLTASHVSLRDDFAVSCPELDLAVDTAIAAGALGARVTGAGFGGCAVALVPETQVPAIAPALHSAFTAARLRVPDVLPVHAAPGPSPLSQELT